jgi:CBS domain containing-hemolysin-like protein
VTVISLMLGMAVVFVVTIATGYFVAQEFAYMAVDRSRLAARADAGEDRAVRALAVTRRTSFMLSGAQLGITVTGLIVGYVAEPTIGGSLRVLLGGVSVPPAASAVIGAVLALLFATFVQMVFGELFPKNLSIARAEPVALRLAGSTTLFLTLFGWLIWFFDQASNLVLRALRIEPVHDIEHSASARDLEHIIADSRERGELSEDLSVMIDRILDFPTEDAEHAMVPRSRVGSVGEGDTVQHVREMMQRGHSRYPVLAQEPEAILGVVHLVDLIEGEVHGSMPVTEIMRPPLVISNLTPLPEVLRELAATRNQLACVVDEYGGFSGVITLEDLAEELVGEIADEHDADGDEAAPPVQEIGGWLVAGDSHVDEVERTLRIDLPQGDYETVAGLIIAHHGGLPDPGDVVRVELPIDVAALMDDDAAPEVLLFEVVEVGNYVPSSVRVRVEDRP